MYVKKFQLKIHGIKVKKEEKIPFYLEGEGQKYCNTFICWANIFKVTKKKYFCGGFGWTANL